jgi:hypothetical protein
VQVSRTRSCETTSDHVRRVPKAVPTSRNFPLAGWREGLDDADTVGTDFAKFSTPDERTGAAVDDLLSDPRVEEQLICSGVRTYSGERYVGPQWGTLIYLHITLPAEGRFGPGDRRDFVADGNNLGRQSWCLSMLLRSARSMSTRACGAVGSRNGCSDQIASASSSFIPSTKVRYRASFPLSSSGSSVQIGKAVRSRSAPGEWRSTRRQAR